MQIDDALIKKAAALLRQGELVAFPTETVYGLGADATSMQALAKLYAAKGRPVSHPVIVHLHALEQVKDWAVDVPDHFWILAEAFWPGPLTMIVRRSLKAVDQVTGGQLAVGLRMPGHPLALALLKEFGEGVAAPSANKFGHVSPTVAKDVEEEFAGEVSLVLDGGACRVGIESTIVDLSGGILKILRPGMIMESQIVQALRAAGAKLQQDLLTEGLAPSSETGQQLLRVPGALPKHYAPRTPMALVPSSLLAEKIAEIAESGNLHSIVVIAFATSGANNVLPGDWIVAESDPSLYAQRIYANLRAIDRLQKDLIVVEEPPDTPEWTGIRDRLRRASSPA